jgi:hypothetical protein
MTSEEIAKRARDLAINVDEFARKEHVAAIVAIADAARTEGERAGRAERDEAVALLRGLNDVGYDTWPEVDAFLARITAPVPPSREAPANAMPCPACGGSGSGAVRYPIGACPTCNGDGHVPASPAPPPAPPREEGEP